MIFEIAMMAATLPFVGGFIYGCVQDYKTCQKHKQSMLDGSWPSTIVALPELSPTVALVIELLKQDDGWVADGKLLTHETGVEISVFQKCNPYTALYIPTVKLTVLDEDQEPVKVEFNDYEKGVLISEYNANISRRVDRRKREVTAALAKRIIAREKGELQPVLGGPGVPLLPAPDNDNSQSVSVMPAGILTYDEMRQQVVAIGGRGSERMNLDVSLERRYRELLGRRTESEADHIERLLKEVKYAF